MNPIPGSREVMQDLKLVLRWTFRAELILAVWRPPVFVALFPWTVWRSCVDRGAPMDRRAFAIGLC